MKRPMSFIGLLFLIIIFISTTIWPRNKGMDDPSDGKTVVFTGRLKMWSEKGDGYILEVEGRAEGGASEKIMAYIEGPPPKLGTALRIKGRKSCFKSATNPGQFDEADYYAAKGFAYAVRDAEILSRGEKYDVIREGLMCFRLRLKGVYSALLNEEQSGVVEAMILGDRADMAPDIKNLYQQAGIAHALAISGLHISILGYGLYKLLKYLRLPKIPSALSCMVLLYLYAVMTGSGTAAIRAFTMFSLSIIAELFDRTYDLISALSFAAILILIVDPNYLYDSGFVLSFGAVLGIGTVLPVLSELWDKPPPKLLQALILSLSISIFTLPAVLWFFFQVPVYASFLNLIVVPLLGILVILSILMGLFGFICLPLGKLIAFPCSLILSIYEKGCELCVSMPFNTFVPGRPGTCRIILYYIVLFAGLVAIRKLNKQKLKRFLAGAVFALLLVVVSFKPFTGLEITMLDIGQGDCLVIRTAKQVKIIDCGSTSVSNIARYRLIPFLKCSGISRIDSCILTHPDQDHINGFREMLEMKKYERLPIGEFILPDMGEPGDAYLELVRLAKSQGIPVRKISAGQGFEEAGRVPIKYRCMNPVKGFVTEDVNAASTVLDVRYGKFTALFTGDLVGEGESFVTDQLNHKYTLLKCAHHGSRFSTGNEFLSKADPMFTFISCGKNNGYGHPHKETLNRLAATGSKIYISRDSGAVTCKTDGKKLKINTFMKERI